MKAQNIYERQERQGANAADEDTRAGMLAEEHPTRMDALERDDAEMLNFPGRPQQASSARSREAQAMEHHRRTLPTDSDQPRLVQEAYSTLAHFPARLRAGSGVRFAHPNNSEHYREMMWTRQQPNIYYRMDELAGFPRQRPRYPDVVDLEQQETKSPLPPPESSGRPINNAGDSLLAGRDGGVRPYVRRRLHASLDRPRRGFIPPHPQMGGAYAKYDRERVGMRRAMKRPLRTRAPPTSDRDAFTEMQSFQGTNEDQHQDQEGVANLPGNIANASADASAAVPVRLEQFELDEDVDEEWVTRPAPRNYRRPVLGYYVRTPEGYGEPVAPPSGTYYYGHPQTTYDDYFDYGDSVEWISDEDDGAYAYEFPRRLERFPAHGLPDGGLEQRRQFVRSTTPGDYRIRSMPDRAPASKRRKVSYGDLREQGYQAESDSAPDDHPAVVLAPPSDEEPRSQHAGPPESSNVPSVEALRFGREVSRGETEQAARSATVSEGEENETGASTEAPVSTEELHSPPDATAAEGPDEAAMTQGADIRDVPVTGEPSSANLAAGRSTANEAQSGETGDVPGLQNARNQVGDVDMGSAQPLPADEVAADTRQSEPDKIAHSSMRMPSSARNEASEDDTMTGLLPSCSATEDPVNAESSRADAHRAVEMSVTHADMPASSTDETSATGEGTTTSNAAAVAREHRVVVVTPPQHVAMPITASMTMNDRLAHSLENMNRCEANLIRVKEELSSQKARYAALQKEEYYRKRLQILLEELVGLQCRLSACDSLVFGSVKYEMLKAIQALLDSTADSNEPAAVKVDMLRKGLESIVDSQVKAADELSPSSASDTETKKANVPAREELANDPACVRIDRTDHDDGEDAEDDHDDQMDDSASPSCPDASVVPDEPQNNAVEDEESLLSTQPAAVAQVVKLERNFDDFGVKQEDVPLDCPAELPSFLWKFLTHSLTPDASQSSYVMRVMYNRLLEEVMKSNPYYYLHRSMLHPRRVQSSTASMCEFGCRGASATKWERKLISQINSRMKSFDNAAYSLARSGGGKDVLNRKKLNSIIRKVHLVAMQVHSLLSHLYCLKGRVVCSEADAMSSALNNSHFERRMGVYKSRLKLVFPHKQSSIGAIPSKEPEDLVRDTFEFFPELLVCVDIWGYNYREALIKRQRERNTIILTADGVPTEPTRSFDKHRDASSLLPQAFFHAVEGKAFDFDNDGNGLLRCICDELLNIVCLWNDFKWMENLEALDLERIITFENGVGSSIIKILGLYADHLQALWGERIHTEPEYLRSARLTQHNAYYTPHSLVPFPLSAADVSAECVSFESPLSPADSSTEVPPVDTVASPEAAADSESVKQSGSAANDAEELGAVAIEATAVAAMTSEHRVAEAYWSRKSRRVNAAKPSPLIDADELVKWGESALSTHLLDADGERELRADLDELSTVASDLLGSCGDECRLTDVAGRYCIVSGDIVHASEKLALHSAANQMRDDTNHQLSTAVIPQDAPVASEVASSTDQSSVRRSRDPRRHEMGDAWSPSQSLSSVLSDQSAVDVMLLADEDEDQPVRDVIEVLAATKRELHELTAQRARSARVREKLQLHAVELARQAVELVRNTAQMYT